MPKPVSVSLTATASGLVSALNQGAAASRSMASQVKSSMAQSESAMDKTAAAAKRVAAAERLAANAAGSVRLAETRLNEVRAKAGASAAQKISAEENLYKASRRLAAAQQEVFDASDQMRGKSFLGGVEENSASIDRVGSSLLKVGAVGAVGLGLISKAAMDWQSDWAGVTKTVDGTAPQLGELEGQLRGLAKTLPASHHEIAAVAEAAGQLGVKRQDVAAFTKTMIDLGETTNLSSDEAATSLAQFMNVMGTSSTNVSRLGATIVDLGNKGASTERDIVGMGLRIAGAGKQVGLTETQVLAFASSLASVGIDAEAGGTAISTSFLKIDGAVRTGGKSLDVLAKTSGMSAAQFRTAWQEDAAGAMVSFIGGLDRVQKEGGSTTAVLKSLGITGIRESDALRRLAASGNLLSDSLATSNTAWKSNSALVDEAAKRYSTAESQAKIAWNQIKDSAISAGTSMLPILAQVATAVGHVAEFFGNLPAPVRIAVVALTSTVTVLGLIGGAGLKALTGLAALRTGLQGVGIAATGMGRAMKIAQIGIPVVGLALFAVSTALQMWAGRSTEASASANSFADAMKSVEGQLNRTSAALNENVRASAIQSLQQSGAFDQAKSLGLGLDTVTDAVLGNKAAIDQVNGVLLQYTDLGPHASKSDLERRKVVLALSDALNQTSNDSIGAIAAENDRRAAMEGGTGATKAAGEASKKHAEDLQAETTALNEATDAAQATANAILALSGSQIGMEGAMDAATQAAKKTTKAQRESGDALDVNKAKGRENQQVLNSLAAATLQYTNSLVKQGASATDVVAANERGRKSWVDAKVAMGGNRREAEALSQALFAIPASVQAQVILAGAQISKKEARELNAELQTIPAEKRAKIVTIAETKGAKAARQAMAEIKDKEVIARSRGDLKGAKQVDAAMKALKDRLVEAKARGDKRGAQQVDAAMKALRDKTVTARINADTSGATEARRAIATVNGKTVTVTIRRSTINSADGGKAAGGPIVGPGSGTSDDVPIMASNGEYMQTAAAHSYYGTSAMDAIRSRRVPKEVLAGYKYGGAISGTVRTVQVAMPRMATGGTVRGATVADIMRMIRQLQDPVDDISDLFVKLRAANRKIAKPAARYTRANAAYDSAKNRQEDLRDRVNRLRREADATKGVTDADRKLRRARADLADANARVSRTSHEKSEATKAYNKVAGRSKELTSQLTEAQKALADAARQVSDGFRDLYTSKSTDPTDWLELMKKGSADLTAFTARLAKLRKAGLSETLVQQIVGMGAVAGSDVADQIAAGGRAMVASLNQANSQLQKAADDLGYSASSKPTRHATGGPVSGPGTGTSDSIRARLSNGEWVVPERAASVPANRAVLAEMTYGTRRPVIERNYAQSYAYGGPVYSSAPSTTDDHSFTAVFNGPVVDPDAALRKAEQRRRDSLARRGIGRRV